MKRKFVPAPIQFAGIALVMICMPLTPVEGQSCPEVGLYYVVRDEQGEKLTESELKLVDEQSPDPEGSEIDRNLRNIHTLADGKFTFPAFYDGVIGDDLSWTPMLDFNSDRRCTVNLDEMTLKLDDKTMRLVFNVSIGPVSFGKVDDYPPKPPYFLFVESLPFQDGSFELDLAAWLSRYERWGAWEEAAPTLTADLWKPLVDAP